MSETWLSEKHTWCTRQSWDRNGRSFFAAGKQRRPARVAVVHSTETMSWPGYAGGASAPTITLDLRTGKARQHVPLEYGARALALSTAGVTDRLVNIDGVVQIELLGAVTPGYPARYGHYDLVGTFPTDDRAHRYLGRLLAALHAELPTLPLQLSTWGRWVAYPESYGVYADQRLTSWQFAAARGLLGHQHVPANDHGDPGRLVGLDRAVEYALALSYGDPVPDDDDHVLVDYPAGHIRAWQQFLNLLGYTDPDGEQLDEDDELGPLTQHAVRTWQDEHTDADTGAPLDVDGLPGPASTKRRDIIMSKITEQLEDVHRWSGNQGQKLDDVLDRLARLERGQDELPARTVTAWLQRKLHGLALHQWLRLGIVPDPEHPQHPADPGTLGDLIRTIYTQVTGKDAPPPYVHGTTRPEPPTEVTPEPTNPTS